MESDDMIEVKVVLLGDSGVGKSSIARRFVNNSFRDYTESTVGASFMCKTLLVDDTAFKFQIWDTAGQEKYHGLTPMYYRNSAAAIITYDVTSPQSFDTLQEWVTELRAQGPPNIVIALAGNKADLGSAKRVPTRTAEEYARALDARFFEVSAKDDTNISELFMAVAKSLPRTRAASNQRSAQTGFRLTSPKSTGSHSNRKRC